MTAQADTPGVDSLPTSKADAAAGAEGTPSGPRRVYTGAALERRKAWGRDSGAKVAAAYKQLTEAK